MPFEIKNTANNQILHRNDQTEKDFDQSQLQEQSFKVALPFGDPTMTQWSFDGIRMSYSDWHYKECVEMEWKGDLEVVHLHFNLKGSLQMRSVGADKDLVFGHHQHNMLYGDGGEGILKNESLHATTFMIQFTREAFLRLTEGANEVLKRFAEKVLMGKPVLLSDNNLYIDLPLQQAIQAVVRCKYQHDLKKLFLLSKAIEILVLQAEAFNKTLIPGNVYAKTEDDKERIVYARDYLIQHLTVPPSLSELARVVGINEFKLKRGFKEIFKTTVFGYLSDTRLELAKTDLLERVKSVSELAYQLGYSSVPHFSSAFKKKFGVSPKQLK